MSPVARIWLLDLGYELLLYMNDWFWWVEPTNFQEYQHYTSLSTLFQHTFLSHLRHFISPCTFVTQTHYCRIFLSHLEAHLLNALVKLNFLLSGSSIDIIIRFSKLSIPMQFLMAVLIRFCRENPRSQSTVETRETRSLLAACAIFRYCPSCLAPYWAMSFVVWRVWWPFSLFFSTNRMKLFISSILSSCLR